ncbi:MAG: WD40 repeat domain-containing protein [Cyanobacteria bacterium J06607_13]
MKSERVGYVPGITTVSLLMYQRNRNLFSLLAVLLTAVLIAAIGGIFLFVADQFGGGPRLLSGGTDVGREIERQTDGDPLVLRGDAVSAEAVSATPHVTLGTHTATVLSVTTSQGSPMVASGSYDNSVKLWNRNDPTATRALSHSGRVNDLAFTPDGQYLVTGSGAGNIKLWNLPSNLSGQRLERSEDLLEATLKGESGRITSLAIDLTSRAIASGSSNGTLKIWDITQSVQVPTVTTLKPLGPQINALAFHPTDPNLLISGDQDGTVKIWDLARGEPLRILEDSADRIVSVDISQNGQYIASGSYDQTIRIWDLETGEQVQTLTGHDFVVSDVSFSPDGMLLVSGSYDESIKVWNWQNAAEACTLNGHAGFVYAVAFADSGNTLVSGGYDGTVRSWDLTAPANQSCLSQ